MANPMKGEKQIELGGESYKVRLTIDGMMAIEQACGMGIIALAQRMGDADISITNVITILHQALRGGSNDVSIKDVTKIVGDAGVVPATQAVAEILTEAFTDKTQGDDAEKKAET